MAITTRDRSAAACDHDVDSHDIDTGDDDLMLEMQAAGVGAWHWDDTTDLVAISRAAQLLIGAAAGALSSTEFLARIHPNDRDVANQALRASVQAGEAHDFDFHTHAEAKRP